MVIQGTFTMAHDTHVHQWHWQMIYILCQSTDMWVVNFKDITLPTDIHHQKDRENGKDDTKDGTIISDLNLGIGTV